MKATGIIRRIDDLGRVVIPKEIRRKMRIREGDPLELFLDSSDGLVLKKYSPLAESLCPDAAKNALKKAYIRFAIYDKDVKLSDTRQDSFPFEVPKSWVFNDSMFTDGQLTVFKIFSTGELVGYIAVTETDKTDYVKAIATMIGEELSLD